MEKLPKPSVAEITVASTYVHDIVVAHLVDVPGLLLRLVEVAEGGGAGQGGGRTKPAPWSRLPAPQPTNHLVQLNRKRSINELYIFFNYWADIEHFLS